MKPFAPERLFWGSDPWGFYGEIVFRSVVMYLVLLVLLRFLSKRALTQLSILEFGIVIVLGSAAGDPTFYKDIPLFHGIVVLLVIVTVQRLYTYLLRHNEAVETAMEGTPILMVLRGVIQADALAQARLSQEELFQLLRCQGISQLGEVKAAYMEQSGQLSVFECDTPLLGLAIVPPWDLRQPVVVAPSVERVCVQCGTYQESLEIKETRRVQCSYCEHDVFTKAVKKGEPD